MSKILVWRANAVVGTATSRKRDYVSITEDGNEPTLIGKPRGPETPICRYCGKDARHDVTLHRFSERRVNGSIASGWRCG